MAAQYPSFNVTANPKIVPVVLPPSGDPSLSGRIRNIPVRGADHSGWLDRAARGWVLKAEKSEEGYRLLEDLYRSEGNESGWEAYVRYLKDWQTKRTTRPFPPHLLPQCVQAWQQGDVAAGLADPWNVPAPAPTTGALSEPKTKPGKASA